MDIAELESFHDQLAAATPSDTDYVLNVSVRIIISDLSELLHYMQNLQINSIGKA